MKGYQTAYGYKGYIPGKGYVLFSCESEYEEAYKEWESEN